MSGQWVGLVDVLNPAVASSPNTNQQIFTSIWRFFNGPLRSSSYADLVAYNTGSSGTGTNYYDETAPFGENAFFVFKMLSGTNAGGTSKRSYDYYAMFQWADAITFGNAPGNPAVMNIASGDGIAFQVAWRDDGLSPWNGTTLKNGNDNKNAGLVWTSGSSTVHVFPRSNNTGGSYTSIKQLMLVMLDFASSNVASRQHFLADRDNIIMLTDIGASNTGIHHYTIIGTYDTFNDLTGTIPMPMWFYNNSAQSAASAGAGSPVAGTVYGSTAGNNVINSSDGGIVGTTGSMSTQVSQIIFDRLGSILTLQPNVNYPSPNRYDAMKIPVSMGESPNIGFCGYAEAIREVGNITQNTMNAASSSIVMAIPGSYKLLIPWSGSYPGSTSTRLGRVFQV